MQDAPHHHAGQSVLVTLTDQNAIEQARQLFCSAYFQGQWPGDFALLAVDLAAGDVESFTRAGVCVRTEALPQLIPAVDTLPCIRFCKHAVFADFFKRWQTVVFMDSDIMVRKPLGRLADVSGFSAVPAQISRTLGEQLCSYGTTLIENQPEIFAHLTKRYGLAAPAFNSGVMAFPSSIIREELRAELRGLTRQYLAICPLEQVLLNLLFYEKWAALPAKYNVPAGAFAQDASAEQAAHVLHFLGPGNKPWSVDHQGTSAYRDEWMANHRRWQAFSARRVSKISTGPCICHSDAVS